MYQLCQYQQWRRTMYQPMWPTNTSAGGVLAGWRKARNGWRKRLKHRIERNSRNEKYHRRLRMKLAMWPMAGLANQLAIQYASMCVCVAS